MRLRTRLTTARTCWQPSTVSWTVASSSLPQRLVETSCCTQSLASNEKCSERGRRSRTANCRRNRPAFSRMKVGYQVLILLSINMFCHQLWIWTLLSIPDSYQRYCDCYWEGFPRFFWVVENALSWIVRVLSQEKSRIRAEKYSFIRRTVWAR